MYNLILHDRLTDDAGSHRQNITFHAQGWTRTTRAIGGYWTGDFSITDATMTRLDIARLYNAGIGRRVVERTMGLVSWEGEIVEMTITIDGVSYTISLDPEAWHNNVVVDYGHAMTASSENTDSSNIFGESQYIDNIDSTYSATAAAAIRDRRLTANAYPRSRASGGLGSASSSDRQDTSLHVICAGYWSSMNRIFRTTDIAAANASTQIGTLVGGSEFVTAGQIDTNTLQVPVRAAGNYPRLWDAVEAIIDMGDGSGNRYAGGVYAGRLFNYNTAATTVTHLFRNRRLLDFSGNVMQPSLIKPDIVVDIGGIPGAALPPGGNVWDRGDRAYIEAVEFTAPDQYRLIPYGAS